MPASNQGDVGAWLQSLFNELTLLFRCESPTTLNAQYLNLSTRLTLSLDIHRNSS